MIIDESAELHADAKQSHGMDYATYLQKGIQILQLDGSVVADVSKDEDALVPALVFFALAGLANGAAQFSFRGMIFGAIVATLLSFVMVGLLNVLARLFGGDANFLELYRSLGVAAPLFWVLAVPMLGPFLGFLAVLYYCVVAELVVERTAELPRPNSIAVIALLVGVSLFLFLVFLALVGSLLLFRTVFS